VKESMVTIEDAQAVNFREIRVGRIAPNTLYRSSHPIKDNKQDKVVSMLASFAKIAAVINLCDTNSGIAGKRFLLHVTYRLVREFGKDIRYFAPWKIGSSSSGRLWASWGITPFPHAPKLL